jgi:hypothetical protein
MPETHNCTFDFMEDWKVKLKESNPIVAGEKVSKI